MDTGGTVLAECAAVSGEQTAEQLALGWPKWALSSHTEAKAFARVFLKEGYTLEIEGFRNPRNNCKGIMRSRSAGGTTIQYCVEGGETKVYE